MLMIPDGDHAVSHDFLHRHRSGTRAVARKCVNDFTFGNKTENCLMFFMRNQSAALLTLASGSIVATSVPFCLRMVSTVTAASPELSAPRRDWPPRVSVHPSQ